MRLSTADSVFSPVRGRCGNGIERARQFAVVTLEPRVAQGHDPERQVAQEGAEADLRGEGRGLAGRACHSGKGPKMA